MDFSKHNPIQMESGVKDNSSERASSKLMSRFHQVICFCTPESSDTTSQSSNFVQILLRALNYVILNHMLIDLYLSFNTSMEMFSLQLARTSTAISVVFVDSCSTTAALIIVQLKITGLVIQYERARS